MGSLLEDTNEKIFSIGRKIGIDNKELLLLTKAERMVVVNCPLKRDDKSLQMIQGFRVLHSNTIGPAKGGLIINSDISLDDTKALATIMTLKTALVGIPLGGSGGAIQVDINTLSDKELERLVRRYTAAVINVIGPEQDVMGPDLNTDERIMSWIMDTYSVGIGHTTHRVVTGKPIDTGGIYGREQAVGLGIGYILHEWARKELEEIQGQSVVIQGIGQVGRNFALATDKLGAKVIAISDSKNGIYHQEGLDVQDVIDYKLKHGNLLDYPNAEKITNETLLTMECDWLIPCATYHQITENNVNNLKCRRIIEGANAAISLKADKILWDRNIPVIPDILANAGGVIVSYFEWVQGFQQLAWSLGRVEEELQRIIVKVFNEVYTLRTERDISFRSAALILAIKRVAFAEEIRGIYP
ncbi:Glu/Leu/Phe/Val dehydrogenase [Promethearchaeum syntrophicum]|uniref:Glutamate dehydrogenase n=1 Tax=Promethearchaeum syntrophicum TaxID=2594042 RepID=A0A5B9DB00_9ARCH|nr:Glu/Leu/Phe/Val dehydrogenase [Candidatus Prometheoarchaeum syntrophicum]QEE16171.1 NAD-specific glutamate dehydrogenase A [Candidatus Prometheoarchaeum syntrophicum]